MLLENVGCPDFSLAQRMGYRLFYISATLGSLLLNPHVPVVLWRLSSLAALLLIAPVCGLHTTTRAKQTHTKHNMTHAVPLMNGFYSNPTILPSDLPMLWQ